MGGDSNSEKKFSEYVDRLLKGETPEVGADADADLKEAAEFSRQLMALGSEPSPAFKSALQRRLLTKLTEREERARVARKWWQAQPNVRWISLAATAAVVILAIVGLLNSTGQFTPAPTPSAPSAPSAPTTPSTPAPSSPTAPSPESPQKETVSPYQLPPQKPRGGAEVSWAFGFDNLPDLTAFSDMVAIVTVDRSISVQDEGRGAYTTLWSLKVEQILKGNQFSELTLSQMGSPAVRGSDISDDPLFAAGERYLLFLREYAPGKYGTIGPWGRYLIWNWHVYSMNHVIVNGGGYRAPSGLDFIGLPLNDMVKNVVKIADSVQLVFTTGEQKLKADVLRYPVGTTLVVDARLSSGEHGPARVALSVDKANLPAGLAVSVQPAEFVAYPRNVYVSTITITMPADLPAGSYSIPVEYDFDGVIRTRRTITLNVDTTREQP